MVPLSCLVHRSACGRFGETTTTDHRFNIGSGSGMAVVLAGPQLAAHQGVWNDPTASRTCKGGLGGALARRQRRCPRDWKTTDKLEYGCESAIGSMPFRRGVHGPLGTASLDRTGMLPLRVCYGGTWLRAGRGDAVTRRSLGGKVRRHQGGRGGTGGRTEG